MSRADINICIFLQPVQRFFCKTILSIFCILYFGKYWIDKRKCFSFCMKKISLAYIIKAILKMTVNCNNSSLFLTLIFIVISIFKIYKQNKLMPKKINKYFCGLSLYKSSFCLPRSFTVSCNRCSWHFQLKLKFYK